MNPKKEPLRTLKDLKYIYLHADGEGEAIDIDDFRAEAEKWLEALDRYGLAKTKGIETYHFTRRECIPVRMWIKIFFNLTDLE